ncbi:heterokaryon incompatibility protein-domain-containing protein [Diaporthe sp. PMI_573]|nr:heterokaryon incompatibility protein-domain-containing protein [Diaporthaceae sp. PMI_573]
MDNIYEFQSLPHGDSIRVLILDAGRDDQPLSGELRVIFLNNRRQTLRSRQGANKRRKTSSGTEITRWTPDIPYEAISYVWGSDKKDHSIVLSGKTHHITDNLSDALQQCRLPDRSRVLWADSICIDQDNGQEKNHQVYLMGRIYASSQRTLICLGADPNNRGHARDVSALITEVDQMIQAVFRRPGFSWEVNSFPWPLPDDPLVRDSRWQSVEILCCHPWLRRGWVVQEAALGREACILWAGCKIALLDVIRAETWYFRRARYVADKSYTRTISIPSLLEQLFFHTCHAESKVFFSWDSQVAKPGILSALDEARQLGLSDPRDRIYAFMALPFVRNPMPDFRPNYEQAHLELYQDFAIKYLTETSDLNILNFVVPKRVNAAPVSADSGLGSSWAPRWDHRATRCNSNVDPFGRASTERGDFAIFHRENGASALLQVQALMFDSIRLISPRFDLDTTVEDLVTIYSQFLRQADSTSKQKKSSSAYGSLAFFKALTAGFLEEVEHLDTGLESYASCLQINERGVGCRERSPHISPEVRAYHQLLMEQAHDSHIFKLENGYLGLGALGIKQGDVCAFIVGVQMPLILRKFPDEGACHYSVICPAFVVSMQSNNLASACGLHRLVDWDNWDELCELEGWTDWGLKEEKIILH